jgi:hypothetical protein
MQEIRPQSELLRRLQRHRRHQPIYVRMQVTV